MKIYSLYYDDRFEDNPEFHGLFSTEEKAREYANYIVKNWACYENNRFRIGVDELDFGLKLMK